MPIHARRQPNDSCAAPPAAEVPIIPSGNVGKVTVEQLARHGAVVFCKALDVAAQRLRIGESKVDRKWRRKPHEPQPYATFGTISLLGIGSKGFRGFAGFSSASESFADSGSLIIAPNSKAVDWR